MDMLSHQILSWQNRRALTPALSQWEREKAQVRLLRLPRWGKVGMRAARVAGLLQAKE